MRRPLIRCAKRICVIPLQVRTSAPARLRVQVGSKVTTRKVKKGRSRITLRVNARAKRVSVRMLRAPVRRTPPPTPAPPTAPTPPPPAALPSIRTADLLNHDYSVVCPPEETVRISVRSGEWELRGPTGNLMFFGGGPIAITYADATGDGVEDALVYTSCTAGGSGSIGNVLIVFQTAVGPMQATAPVIGRDPTFENGQLVTREYVRGDNDPAGSYSWTVTKRWELQGAHWVLVSEQRAYTPTSQG